MTSVMTSCGDWLNSTPAETKVEPFGLSLWSQRKTDPESEIPVVYVRIVYSVVSLNVIGSVMFAGMQETLDLVSTITNSMYVSDTDTIRGIQCIQPS